MTDQPALRDRRRIELGDSFRYYGYAGPIYLASYAYQFHGQRRIVGWYHHAPNQKVGIDLPDDELEYCAV